MKWLYSIFLLFILSEFISSFSSCDKSFDIPKSDKSEVTHYISEVHKIKNDNLFINYKDIVLDGGSQQARLYNKEIENSDYNYSYPYTDKNNNINYIIYNAFYWDYPDRIYREFFNKFLFLITPKTEVWAFYNQYGRDEYSDFNSYYYVSTDNPENGYNLKRYYIKDKSYIPIIEKFFKSIKDTFNRTKIEVYTIPEYPNNLVLLDTIKEINIYCNSDYNDEHKKGSLLNDVMKIVYFNHAPFLQDWYKKAINDNGMVTTVNYRDNILFPTLRQDDNTDNFTEEWLEDFNTKTNTNRLLLHPEMLLLCTEDPAVKGEYSFTIEFIYNTSKKIVQETPSFVLLKDPSS